MAGTRERGRIGWAEHLAGAAREGKSLSQYAREHGLSVSSLYMARHQSRGGSTRTNRGARTSPFVPIKVSASPPSTSGARLQARLPNGVIVECAIAPENRALLETLLDGLSRLPCSA